MAKFVLLDPVITVDAVDLSDHCNAVTVEGTSDEVDVTGFQSDYREILQGLKDASFTATFLADFATGEVDDTLWDLFNLGSTFTVSVKADDAATSATNPEFSMTAVLLNYSPIAGGIGEASSTDVTFRNATQTGITRGTA